MGKTSAVCIKCGNFKPSGLAKCTECGFLPTAEDDAVRSLILSKVFDAGQETVGLNPDELVAASEAIRAGRPYNFDPNAVAKVRLLHRAAKAITPRRLAIDLVRWLAPPIILLAVAYWLLFHK